MEEGKVLGGDRRLQYGQRLVNRAAFVVGIVPDIWLAPIGVDGQTAGAGTSVTVSDLLIGELTT